jgi:hypothetical protein
MLCSSTRTCPIQWACCFYFLASAVAQVAFLNEVSSLLTVGEQLDFRWEGGDGSVRRK